MKLSHSQWQGEFVIQMSLKYQIKTISYNLNIAMLIVGKHEVFRLYKLNRIFVNFLKSY